MTTSAAHPPYGGGRGLLSRVLLSLLLVLAGTGVLTPAAQAHDELIGSQPEDGDTLDAAPEEIVLTFSGEIAALGAEVVVTGPDGDDVASGEPAVDGVDVVQALAPDAPDGAYAVLWRVTSEDGHPISGELDYEVATPETEPEPAPDAAGATSSEPGDDAALTSAPQAGGTGGQDPAAATDAALPAAEPTEDDGGVPTWVWFALVGAALATLAAVGVLAVRRR